MKKKLLILVILILYSISKPVLAETREINPFESQEAGETTTLIETQNSETDNTLESQENEFGISNFLDESKKYTNDFDVTEVFTSSVSGKFDNKKILKFIFGLFEKNMQNALKNIASIIVVIIISSLLKTICENLGNESVSKIASYVQYIIIVVLLMKNFSDVTSSIKTTMENANMFANSLIPVLTTLMIATGNIVSSGIIEPILLLIVTFISNFITNALIPIILVATALGIISKISDQVQVNKLSKFMKSGTVWLITTILMLFVSIASVEGGLTSSIDAVTVKTSKSIVSTVVPIVGKILSDAVDTVLGYTNIIKNGVGVVGIIVIVCIFAKPIIELASLTIVYYLGAALCEPVADKNVTELIEQIAGTFKIFLAIMFVVATVLIVGIAIVMKMSSTGG